MIQPSEKQRKGFRQTTVPGNKRRHLRHHGPGNAKNYHERKGASLLTGEEIQRRWGRKSKGGKAEA